MLWKCFTPVTNTLDHYDHSKIPALKCFTVLGPSFNLIEVFYSVDSWDNSLAYYEHFKMMTVKRFITLGPSFNVIEVFHLVGSWDKHSSLL